MAAQRARESRQPVRIGARLRNGQGWSDMVLRNVSARGMMGECRTPLRRGEYVEVRCGGYVIVARVAWTGGERFGARAQDLIALPDLVASAEGRGASAPERRREPRPARPAKTLEERGFSSARLGRAFEFVTLILAGAALAVVLGGAAHDALATPADRISQALAGGAVR